MADGWDEFWGEHTEINAPAFGWHRYGRVDLELNPGDMTRYQINLGYWSTHLVAVSFLSPYGCCGLIPRGAVGGYLLSKLGFSRQDLNYPGLTIIAETVVSKL